MQPMSKTLPRKAVREYESGATLIDLSVQYKMSFTYVALQLKNMGCRMRRPGRRWQGGPKPYVSQKDLVKEARRQDRVAQAFHLREEGHTFSEIADALGCSRQNVQQLLEYHRAKMNGTTSAVS